MDSTAAAANVKRVFMWVPFDSGNRSSNGVGRHVSRCDPFTRLISMRKSTARQIETYRLKKEKSGKRARAACFANQTSENSSQAVGFTLCGGISVGASSS